MANTVLLEARSYRPFKSSEEYLYAMREDLAEWLNLLYPDLRINTDNFMDRLDTGVALCKHANNVRKSAEEYLAKRHARNKSMTKSITTGLAGPILAMGNIHFLPAAKSGTFFARDNVSNFISWCRKSLQIFECLLFETDDLIMRKNEKHVILCLLEVARRGAKFGMLAPMLVQMERQIDREIAADNRANGVVCGTQTDGFNTSASDADDMFDSDSEDEDEHNEPVLVYGPQPQIITNDLKSLDEMVRDLVEKCTCPSQFPMVRVSEGKYRIGDTKVLIFVRILRSHVMVRVGGGWDTLSHYLDKHDPCRCKAQHRSSVAARLITRTNHATNGIELHKAQVFYERSPPSARRVLDTNQTQQQNHIASPNTNNGTTGSTLSPPSRARSRSRSPTTHKRVGFTSVVPDSVKIPEKQSLASPIVDRRSMSPSPRRIIAMKTKQLSLDSTSAAVVNNNSIMPIPGPLDGLNLANETKSELINGDGKFENVSDNGSEISDEGYRSLGLIQANNQNNNTQTKPSSLQSQTSAEDADLNVRLEQVSSDSQTSPTDEAISSQTSTQVDDIPSSVCVVDAVRDVQTPLTFEQSGIFITEDDITVDIATTTGLRKTDFSANLYGDDGSVHIKPLTESKIPRSPNPIRRKSIESVSSEVLPVMSRKTPVYRSVRKPAITMTKDTPSSNVCTSKDINTWSGRTNKKRPAFGSDTFRTPPAATGNNSNNTFNRSSTVRHSASTPLYDKNGRRIKSTTTSPTKISTSPLAQQILEVAGSAQNDPQLLEKMKSLLMQYTKTKSLDEPNKEYDDFTTAWVNSNGKLDRAMNCSPSPRKLQSRHSSAASSIDSIHSKDGNSAIPVVSPRRVRGTSRIPGPIRQNTELY